PLVPWRYHESAWRFHHDEVVIARPVEAGIVRTYHDGIRAGRRCEGVDLCDGRARSVADDRAGWIHEAYPRREVRCPRHLSDAHRDELTLVGRNRPSVQISNRDGPGRIRTICYRSPLIARRRHKRPAPQDREHVIARRVETGVVRRDDHRI